jgi:hypothetical protein
MLSLGRHDERRSAAKNTSAVILNFEKYDFITLKVKACC